MEANAYDNNAEINHTWELKCQHCQSCQQCGLFRRLILDLVTQGGGQGSKQVLQGKGRAAAASRRVVVVFFFSRHLQCLLSTGKGGWLCLKCLSSGPRQLRGKATSDCTCSSGLGARTIPQTGLGLYAVHLNCVYTGATAPQLGAHFISTLKSARQRQQGPARFRHFSSSPFSSSLLASGIVVRLCLYFTLVWTFD